MQWQRYTSKRTQTGFILSEMVAGTVYVGVCCCMFVCVHWQMHNDQTFIFDLKWEEKKKTSQTWFWPKSNKSSPVYAYAIQKYIFWVDILIKHLSYPLRVA